MRTKAKIRIFASLGLILLVGAVVGVKAGQFGAIISAGKTFVPPPESITAVTVEPTTWQASLPAVASLVAVHGVTLGAELQGTIREIGFDSGTFVRKGTVLVKLDTSTEEAQLKAALADAQLGKANLDRARSLRQGGSNSPADLDATEARAKQSDAMVAQLRATIAKKSIRAPFDGRIAIRQVELGQVVSTGTPIASLQSVDPIFAEFTLPQQALADLKVGQPVKVRTDTFPGASWDVKLSEINSEVDVATRNIRVRALVPNGDGKLRPGMFANVEVLSSESHPVLPIPATAVLFAPYGDSVFTVEQKTDPQGRARLVARQTFVRLGERRGDLVAVLSGLKAGETVVSTGAFKLRNGAAVVVKNDLAPRPELAPKPTDK
jgi:membrane fusion protein (multidrug efflux system)